MSIFKTALLLTALTLLLIGIGYFIAGPVGASIALFIALMMNLISFWFSDRIVIGMFRGRPASPTQYPELHRMVDNLSGAALIPKPKLWLLPFKVPNAFATGRSPHYASIAVTETMLNTLNKGELEGVLSHEMAHIKNRDTLIATIAATLAGAVMMIAYWARWIAVLGAGDRDRGGIGVIGLLLLSILAPLAALIIQMAVSRTEEYRADKTGAYLSGRPLDLASALEKLQLAARRRPLGGSLPHTSHLFIVNPFRAGFLFRMFSTHPPTEERVKRLRTLAGIL
jgi:heat shock protein HtpX